MEKFKHIIPITVLLSLVAGQTTASRLSVFTRSQHLPGQQFGYSTSSLENGMLIYTVCDNSDVQRKCKVVQEDVLNGTVTHSCDIVLKIETEGFKFGLFREFTFGKHKAILIWEEKKDLKVYVRFTTIQLANCKIGETKLLDDNESLEREPIHHQLYVGDKVIAHNNTYDVFFEASCDKRECKLSIDAEGKIISGPTPFVNNSQFIIRKLKLIGQNTPQDQVLASLKMNKDGKILSLVKSDGLEKPLASFDKSRDILGFTVEHEIIAICLRSRNETYNITCKQYEINGNLKSEVNFSDIESQTHMSAMYPLPNGGYLILFLKVDFNNCQICDNHPVAKHYWITKVDARSKTDKLILQGFNSTRFDKYSEFIYENPNGDGYCATVVYSNYDSTSKIRKVNDRNVVSNCFTEADFTA